MKNTTISALLFGTLLWAPDMVRATDATTPTVESDAADFPAALQRRAKHLAATGKPLELLIASRLALPAELSALARSPAAPTQSDAWLAEAIALGSDKPMIARAAANRCIVTGQCDIPIAINTLQTREGDEAVAQLLLWRMAVAREDAGAAAAAWGRVVQSSRVVDEFAEVVGLLDRMTGGIQPPLEWAEPGRDSETLRFTMVYSLAAFWIPSLVPVHRECPAKKGTEPKHGCAQLAALMADSTSPLISSVGISKMESYAQEEAERKRWQERKRQLDWVIENAIALQGEEATPAPVDPHDYLRWISETGELPAMRRSLAAQGVAAQPPADWQSSRR